MKKYVCTEVFNDREMEMGFRTGMVVEKTRHEAGIFWLCRLPKHLWGKGHDGDGAYKRGNYWWFLSKDLEPVGDHDKEFYNIHSRSGQINPLGIVGGEKYSRISLGKPYCIVVGVRGVGKTTFIEAMLAHDPDMQYLEAQRITQVDRRVVVGAEKIYHISLTHGDGRSDG